MRRSDATRRGLLAAGVIGIAGVAAVGAIGAGITGPSSSDAPYIVPTEPGVVTRSVLTVGDSVPGANGGSYRMVGIPDGLGAFDNGNGTFTLLMNHELNGASAGVQRAHGAKGAFVSKWTIKKGSLKVLKGEDLIQGIRLWDPATTSYAPAAKGVVLTRLCSADLPAPSAFYNRTSGKGYRGRLFMNGEESGAEGRAFAHALDGTSYELPYLGKFSWENSVAQPGTGDRTVVVGLDDSGSGQIYVYIGTKRASGNPVERAGLVGGKLYGVKVDGAATENPATGIASGTAFSLYELGDVSTTTGAALETASNTAQITAFNRPEDGSWNPEDVGEFYFATTASFTGNSRLWRLDFSDPSNPQQGGTIDMLLDGTEGPKMMDNLTVTDRGQVIIQEDPGNQAYVAKIWRYSIADDAVTEIAQHDPARYEPGQPGFVTQDEESSGIIPAGDVMGEGWFLGVQQTHKDNPDPELVEYGQLFAMHVPPGRDADHGRGKGRGEDHGTGRDR
jgi:hypothetical protein